MKLKLSSPLLFLGITAITVLGTVSMPLPAAAQIHVGIGIGIPLPPPIVFSAEPGLVMLPGLSVYAAPDLGDDLYYEGGWWWRPWQGHWYRSHYYDRDWGYYDSVPSFYGRVPQDWRQRYQSRQWGDRPWNYERVSPDRLRGGGGSHYRGDVSRTQQPRTYQASASRTQSHSQPSRGFAPSRQGSSPAVAQPRHSSPQPRPASPSHGMQQARGQRQPSPQQQQQASHSPQGGQQGHASEGGGGHAPQGGGHGGDHGQGSSGK